MGLLDFSLNPSGLIVAPEVDSAPDRNEYEGYLLGGGVGGGLKGAGAYGWQPYYLHVPAV